MLTVTSVILVLAVAFVNGLTDAPNAIATVVVTRCMSLKKALFVSAFFNFLGIIVMSAVNNSVTETVSNIVDFGSVAHFSSVALSSALFSIVLWAVVAWYFGIPTSESHALIAGLTGSGLALNGSLDGIRLDEWIKAFKGLFTSCGVGFIFGVVICKTIVVVFRNIKRQKGEKFFTMGSILSSVGMSFMHGAQDGQKFIAVLNLCIEFSGKESSLNSWFAVLLCSNFDKGFSDIFFKRVFSKSVNAFIIILTASVNGGYAYERKILFPARRKAAGNHKCRLSGIFAKLL